MEMLSVNEAECAPCVPSPSWQCRVTTLTTTATLQSPIDSNAKSELPVSPAHL